MAIWHYNEVVIKFSLRLPDELYKAIREIAEKEQRSINGQIIYILMEYIRKAKAKQSFAQQS